VETGLKTAETKITKLATGIVHHESWTHLILDQMVIKVKVTWSKSAKHIPVEGDQVPA